MSIIVHKGEVISFTHPALGFSISHVSGHLPFKYLQKVVGSWISIGLGYLIDILLVCYCNTQIIKL